MNYTDFLNEVYEKAKIKGISDIFENEACYVETGYDRVVDKHLMKSYAIKTSIFAAVEDVNTETELFGQKFSMPIIPAAMSRLTNITKQPMMEIAKACKELNVPTTIGVSDIESMKRVASVGGKIIKIMKPYRDYDKMKAMVKAANECNLFAIGTDLDLCLGKKSGDSISFADNFSPKSVAEIAELVDMANMPFVLKGITSVEDALIAKDIGCKGIVITTHGNMIIDYLVRPLEVVEAIREAVGDEMTILVNGGIQRGSDIYKYLALGADAVTVGKMTWMGLIQDEANGVMNAFNVLNDELKRYMAYTGAGVLSDITPKNLHLRHFLIEG